MSHIAVIYRIKLHVNLSRKYQALWKEMVRYLKSQGAIGSALHEAEDGTLVIYSRWPSYEIYQAAWPSEQELASKLPPHMVDVAAAMKSCIKEVQDTQVLSVLEDQLLP